MFEQHKGQCAWNFVEQRRKRQDIRSERQMIHQLCKALQATVRAYAFILREKGGPWKILSQAVYDHSAVRRAVRGPLQSTRHEIIPPRFLLEIDKSLSLKNQLKKYLCFRDSPDPPLNRHSSVLPLRHMVCSYSFVCTSS